MSEIIKETTTTQDNTNTVATNPASSGTADSQSSQTTTTQRNINPAVDNQGNRQASGSQTATYFVYFLFGVLEILLAFRFVLKLAGASHTSGFVNFIYGLSGVFVAPFNGIFHTSLAQGAETTSIFEPSALVALIVYALVAWGIVKLIQISSGKQQAE
ncbi:MAG: YggT family protein [Patescibacteria group bacterium]|jgi:hypothetical protein